MRDPAGDALPRRSQAPSAATPLPLATEVLLKRYLTLGPASWLDGFIAGLAAGCVFLTVELLARVLFTVRTLPELIQDRLVQHLPGPVFAFILDKMLYLGKPTFFASLLALQAALGALAGLAATRWRRPFLIAGLLFLVTGVLILPLAGRPVFNDKFSTGLTLLLAYAAYAVALMAFWPAPAEAEAPVATQPVVEAPSQQPARFAFTYNRRELMGGGVFLLATVALARKAIGKLPHLPPSGLPQPVTPVEDFYIVSKNILDPEVAAADWRLKIDGLATTPLTLSYDDIKSMPSQEFLRTMECISNEVGGDLISTGRFTGVRLSDVLARAGVHPEATTLHFTSVDGYTENMTLQKAMDPNTFLVYLLDGAPLPTKHGFPLRVLGAGTYGMKNPKWLTHIELVTSGAEGFWEHQGWDPDAIIQTMSRIDRPTTDAVMPGDVLMEGIAFGGDRGIQKVEVSTDGGKTWQPADLQPAQGPLTWVFWQHQTALAAGTYDVVVRATDGMSTLQSARDTDTYPNGATGYNHVQLHVRAGKALT